MKKYILIVAFLGSCTTIHIPDYKLIEKDSIQITPFFCRNEKYSIENKPLNGNYKIKYDHSTFYAKFFNGNIVENSFWYRKGGIFLNEKHDSIGNLISITHHQNKKEKENIKYYNNSPYLMYDSVKTYIIKDIPYKSTFYFNKKENNVIYKISPNKVDIETKIEDFKVSPDDISLNSISRLIFNKCPENPFLFDSKNKEYYNHVTININSDKHKKTYKYNLKNVNDGNASYEQMYN